MLEKKSLVPGLNLLDRKAGGMIDYQIVGEGLKVKTTR